MTPAAVTVGAATSIARLIAAIDGLVAETPAFGPAADHLRRIAGHHVRGVGSVGGNLMMAQRRGFESDLATVTAGLGATVSVAMPGGGSRTMDLLAFLAAPLPLGSQLLSVTVPRPGPDDFFRSYKVALRPLNARPRQRRLQGCDGRGQGDGGPARLRRRAARHWPAGRAELVGRALWAR